MITAQLSQVMNPAQMMVINSFATVTSHQEETELRELLLDFYNRKLQKEMERLWDEGVLNQEKLDEMRTEHFRTPYTAMKND